MLRSGTWHWPNWFDKYPDRSATQNWQPTRIRSIRCQKSVRQVLDLLRKSCWCFWSLVLFCRSSGFESETEVTPETVIQKCNVAVLGSAGVGKTQLVSYFCGKAFITTMFGIFMTLSPLILCNPKTSISFLDSHPISQQFVLWSNRWSKSGQNEQRWVGRALCQVSFAYYWSVGGKCFEWVEQWLKWTFRAL